MELGSGSLRLGWVWVGLAWGLLLVFPGALIGAGCGDAHVDVGLATTRFGFALGSLGVLAGARLGDALVGLGVFRVGVGLALGWLGR